MKIHDVGSLCVLLLVQNGACMAQTVERVGADAMPAVRDESNNAQSRFEGARKAQHQTVELQRQGIELQRQYHSPTPSKSAIEEQRQAEKAQNKLFNTMRHSHKGDDARLFMGRYDAGDLNP